MEYCDGFGLIPIRGLGNRKVRPIPGMTRAIDGVKMQNPFRGLRMARGVDLLVLEGNVATLLSMRDVLTNGLDISIQQSYVSHKNRTHHLHQENNFGFMGAI